MRLVDDRLLLSASGLVTFMECEHLSALDLRAAYGVEAIKLSCGEAALLVARKVMSTSERPRSVCASRGSMSRSSRPLWAASETWMNRLVINPVRAPIVVMIFEDYCFDRASGSSLGPG